MNSEDIKALSTLLAAIVIIVALLVWLIPASERRQKELEAKTNKACVEQYGDGSYFKSIHYGRGGSTVKYCVMKDGSLKIFKEK